MIHNSRNLLWMLSLNIALNAQDSIALKNDNAQVTEDGSISISVLKNDDIKDKSNLILEIVEAPKFGTAEINGNSIVYTPNPNANGIEVFRYKADTGTASGTAQVRVNVNAVNDAPEAIVLEKNTILENIPAGTVIGALTTTDPDEDDRFSYELARDGSRDNFKINGSNLVTKQPFDFEETATYTVTIQTTDSGNKSFVGTVSVKVENENEPPILKGNKNLKLFHAENAGKIVASLEATDPDADQTGIKYKLSTSPDKGVFKITRSGDLSFLREPDFENPIDENKDNVYEVAFKAIDSKNSKMFVEGTASITLTDELETDVKTLDKRKFIAWTVDHQPYHILMEDAIQDYIDLKYMDDESNVDGIDDGNGEVIRELNPTDQIILVQKKDNSDEIHEIWYGNGLDYTIIDREKVDWVFSQDIQTVLMTRDQYLTNDSETVFHESESERLIAGYGSQFSVWHSSNFKLSLSSLSMRSNLLQYAANMRAGNELIGLPGKLGGSSELGVATQRSEFGFRMPFSLPDAAIGDEYKKSSVLSDEYGGLYARGNIENLFSTKADFHGLIGFTFYPSSGEKLDSLSSISNVSATDSEYWKDVRDQTENVNILDSYALVATTVEVPAKLSFIGRLTAAPGFHYLKVAHRLKDARSEAKETNQKLYERTFYNQRLIEEDSTTSWSQDALNDEGNSFTRLNSFYIRFDLLGQIGQKPNFIEKLSFLDFIKISKVPFYEFSFQHITGLNTIYTLNLNLSDDVGISLTGLNKNGDLKGDWIPSGRFWFGVKYRANF
jgi:hypothetical protein